MQDEFADSRWPDLPTAGYATPREKALTDEIMMFLRGAERDRKLLLTILRDGKGRFRVVGRQAWAHLRVDTDLCDKVWGYLAFFVGCDPRTTDEGVVRERATEQLRALVAYEAQSMAQRIWSTQEHFLRTVHQKTKP